MTKRKAQFRVETIHFGVGEAAIKGARTDIVGDGSILYFSSDRFRLQHGLRILRVSEGDVRVEPLDAASAQALLYRGKPKDEIAPRAYDEEPSTEWRETVSTGEVLVLQEPGLMKEGVRWVMMLEEIQ